MKILSIFWDMARINLLNVHTNELNKTPIDIFLESIGGTTFTNCYTPAPDTPRSLACYQTGLYPHFNGCDTRIKWPFHFINDETLTLYEYLSINGFKQDCYVAENTLKTGPFKNKYQDINFFHEVKSFNNEVKKNLQEHDNYHAHLHLQDYHWVMDDLSSNYSSVKIAHEKILSATKKLLEDIDLNKFDCIFVFSDHGHKLDKEYYTEARELLIDDDRCKILMHVRINGNLAHKIDNKLCSILDVFDTYRSIIENVAYENSLLSKSASNRRVIIEDHDDFSVSMHNGISQWRQISLDSDYIFNQHGFFSLNGKVIESINYNSKYIEDIFSCSPEIKGFVKKMDIFEGYKKLSYGGVYTDGSQRYKLNKFTVKLKKAMCKFL